MNRKMIVFYIFFLSTILLIHATPLTYAETVESTPVKGMSNLEFASYPDGEQKVSLHGEWEFYWQQLLNPEDVQSTHLQPEYIQVPSSWRGQMINGEGLPKSGYGTYRIRIKIPPADIGKNKVLYLDQVGSAYQLWIDGVKKESIGVVGKSVEEEAPKLRLNLIYFEPKQEIVDIIIQVSNFSFREGGILGDVSYGETEALTTFVLIDFIKEILIIGGFFFIGLYHLIIYGVRKQDVSLLLLGVVGVLAAIRTLLLSEYLVLLLFENMSWRVMVRIEYLVELAGFLFIILLLKHMYAKEVQKIALTIAYAFTILCSGYILLVPTRVFTDTMPIQVSMMMCILLYFVYSVGILAAIRKREGARINVVGLLILIVGTGHDVLYYIEMTRTGTILEYCVFLFFLLQAVILAYRNSLLFQKNNLLTLELVQLNQTLEDKVVQRTQELHDKNEQLFQLAAIDGLTGVYNRRYFVEKVKEQQKKEASALALLLLDIDDFKQVNDTYGHTVGDQVLMEVSNLLKAKRNALVGRMGGEEFAVLLNGVNEEQSLEAAEQLRASIEKRKITIEEEMDISVTACIGIAVMKNRDSKFEDLYLNADVALYQSKKSGKNKVTLG